MYKSGTRTLYPLNPVHQLGHDMGYLSFTSVKQRYGSRMYQHRLNKPMAKASRKKEGFKVLGRAS